MDPVHVGRLPDGLDHVRTTDVFDEATAPAGLRRAHRVAEGVWGRLVVHSGALRFGFDDEPGRMHLVGAGGTVVIPPGRFHHVELGEPVTFAIEFHRAADHPAPQAGHESGGLAPA